MIDDDDILSLVSDLEAEGGALIISDRIAFAEPGGYYHFFKAGWHTVNGDELIDEEYVRFLCDHMERLMRGELSSNRLLINIPPSHSKSMICVVFALAWLWTIDPTAYAIFAHKDQALARDMARKTRQVVTSEWYVARWGDKVRLLEDATKIDRFSNTAGGGRVAVTVRQQITGAHAKGKFGGLIVIDDPDRPDDTEVESANTLRWYREVLPTRFASLKTSQICIVQQRISQKDLSAYVLDSEEGYVHVNLPMHYDPARHCATEVGEDWRTEPGELLSPLRNDEATISRTMEQMGDPRIALAQYEQKPSFDDGNIFKVEYFDARYDVLPRALQWSLSCDLTFTGEKSSDYAVIQCWANDLSTGKHLLDDMVRRKMGFVETAQTILKLAKRYGRPNIIIEKAANGFAVIDILTKAGVENIHEFSAGKNSKEARATTVSYLFDRGDVLFPRKPSYDLDEYIREMTGFPAVRHDDVVDATTMYLAFMAGNTPLNLANAFRFAGTFASGIK
jgi:predicted phage terminase large subunit-like protein